MIPRLYGLIAVAVVLAGAWLYLSGRSRGAELCEARHAAAQAIQTEKVRKTDAIRDARKPAGDRVALLAWLRKHASGE